MFISWFLKSSLIWNYDNNIIDHAKLIKSRWELEKANLALLQSFLFLKCYNYS